MNFRCWAPDGVGAEVRRRFCGLSLGVALSVAGSHAAAQADDASRATARDLASSGVEAYQQSNFALASERLEKAYGVLQVPSVGLWSARALVKQGRLVQASERYREVMRLNAAVGDAAVQKRAQEEASTELDALLPRMPRLTIRLEGAQAADLTLTVDGINVAAALVGESRPVDPGKHLVVARRGQHAERAEVALSEGETKDVLLRFDTAASAAPAANAELAPAPADSARPVPTSVFVGLAFTGAFALGAGATGFLALGKRSDYLDANNGRNFEDAKDLSGQTKTLNVVTDVLLGAAVVSAGVTTYLFVSRPSAPDRGAHLRLEPSMGRRSAGFSVAGAF